MNRRSRAPRGLQHAHCDSCYSRRCRAPAEEDVCCALVSCRLLCGAVYHQCKEPDHLLLCPDVRVPCLNVQYGCPAHLTRSSRAAHLQDCPASVVSCSMEWNRWPVNDAHSYPNPELHDNLLRHGGREEGGGGLDLDMALKDQDRLFHSLKMKTLFPELVLSVGEEEEEEERQEQEVQRRAAIQKEEAAKAAIEQTTGQWEAFSIFSVTTPQEEVEEEEEEELTQEERESIARGEGLNQEVLEQFNAWERMFSMERGGCREAKAQGGGAKATTGQPLGAVMEEEVGGASCGQVGGASCRQVGGASCRQVNGECSAAPPEMKRFEFGHVEPMKIVAVRTFQVPSSFLAKRNRIRNPGFYKRESRAVDTSDLEGNTDVPIWDEVQASLLCSLEKEQRGHLIAESVCTDGLLEDEGTQTYNFRTTPFRRDTSLAHLSSQKPRELHLQLQVESVSSRHNKASSAFTFLCGQTFQRREYAGHYKNVHSDIQMCMNGWFQHRCPLAYLGCTYSQRRFQPSTHEANVTYNQDLGCFTLRPSTGQHSRKSSQRRSPGDLLSSLPFEVLCHVTRFLDSLSLSQLALVSRLLRQVCCTRLQDRGMVTLSWERRASKWRVKQKVWHFSTMFSPVDAWSFSDAPPMALHLKTCPFYRTNRGQEPVLLPRFTTDI